MAKRGHEINLASGTMFSPAQEGARMQKMRTKLAIDLTKQYMPTKGVSVEHFKRPGGVHEFHFVDSQGRKARRSLDIDMIKKGGRNASCHMMESVLYDYDIDFDWHDVPNEADYSEPVERVLVDHVGGPPENADRIPHTPAVPPEPVPDPPAPETVPDPAPDVAWNPDWTIPQLKEWSAENGHPVPSSITRKGDIIAFIAREHTN